MKTPTPVVLGYGASGRGVSRRKAVTALWVSVVVSLTVVIWTYKALIGQGWNAYRFAAVQRQCVAYADAPDSVAYETDAGTGERLVATHGNNYQRIAVPGNPVGRSIEPYRELLTQIGPNSVLLPGDPLEGAAVFLHERRTASGRRVLVYCYYEPPGTAEAQGHLHAIAMDLPIDRQRLSHGGHSWNDVQAFVNKDARAVAWPKEKRLPRVSRIYAGQAVEHDPSAFTVLYEMDDDGKARQRRFAISDPAQDDPLGWVRFTCE